MRFLFETTPEEYATKRIPLIKALADEFQAVDPELTNVLEKALPHKEPALKYRMLRDLQKRTSAAYQDTLDNMLAEIGTVLDSSVSKSEGRPATHDEVRKALQAAGIQELNGQFQKADEKLAKQEPGEEPDDPDYEAESGEPIFDPKTGLSPSEQASEEAAGTADTDDEGEDSEKSITTKSYDVVDIFDHDGPDDPDGVRQTRPSDALEAPLAPWEGKDVVAVGEMLVKSLAGPYIGPKGGKWADPEHKIPWRATASGTSKLKEWAENHGGKLKEHKTDGTKVVVKVPKSAVTDLHKLKVTFGVDDPIIMGGHYAILAVPLQALSSKLQNVQKIASEPKAPPKLAGAFPEYAANNPWTEPKTTTDASVWCGSHGIAATFPDLPTAIEVTKALSESHPMVLEHLQFIGTPQQQMSWAKGNPELREFGKKGPYGTDLAKNVLLPGSAAAIANPMGNKPYTKSIIVLKPSYWGKKKATESASSVGGFSVSGNLGDTVRHELGHVEGFVMRHLQPQGGQGPSMWDLWKKHIVPVLKSKTRKSELRDTISAYAAVNPHEAWAELAVLRRRATSLPAWASKAFAEMKVDSGTWESMK